MLTRDQENQELRDEFAKQEAGVVDALELYERIEKVYLEASGSVAANEIVYTSDSANLE